MGFLDDLKRGAAEIGSKTRKSFDITKIEHKLRGYLNEADEIYKIIGHMVYEEHKKSNISEETLEGFFKDLDNINHRIKILEKNLMNIKKETPKAEKLIVEKDSNFSVLNKKVDDLTIRRTSEGIKILKFCPKCHSENPPNSAVCANCLYEFKKKREA